MLKIKDDIKFKELKQYGFKPFNDIRSFRLGYLVYREESTEIFINNEKVITMSNSKNISKLDILYNLIKADLVEKI